jgi:hypothetical protein
VRAPPGVSQNRRTTACSCPTRRPGPTKSGHTRAAVGDEGLQGGDLFGGEGLGGEGEDADVVLREQREGEWGGPVGGDLVSLLAESLGPIPVGLVNGVSAVPGIGDHPVRFVKQDPAPLGGLGRSGAGTEPGRDACQDQGKGHNDGW